jgi:DNA transformation protein
VSVSPSFRTFVLEQLARSTVGIRAQSMFGGVGIYGGNRFFALIDEDVLYFKVDDSNRFQFESRGMRPFQPYGPEGEVMQYYQVPDDVLEDPEELGRWAEAALEVAARAKQRRSGRRGPR